MLYLRSDVGATENIFKYYNGGFGDADVRINFKADGSAIFSNRIDLNGGVTVDGGASMSTGFYYRNDSGAEGVALYKDGSNSANRTVHIKSDGTASFEGKLTSASTTSGDPGTTLATKDYVDANGGSGGGTTYNGANAWGKVAGDGTLLQGLNCTTSRIGNGQFRVVFIDAMPNADYAVTFGSMESRRADILVETQEAVGFTYRIFDSGPDANNTVDSTIGFAVHATNAAAPRGGTGADSWGSVADDGSLSDSIWELCVGCVDSEVEGITFYSAS